MKSSHGHDGHFGIGGLMWTDAQGENREGDGDKAAKEQPPPKRARHPDILTAPSSSSSSSSPALQKARAFLLAYLQQGGSAGAGCTRPWLCDGHGDHHDAIIGPSVFQVLRGVVHFSRHCQEFGTSSLWCPHMGQLLVTLGHPLTGPL